MLLGLENLTLVEGEVVGQTPPGNWLAGLPGSLLTEERHQLGKQPVLVVGSPWKKYFES